MDIRKIVRVRECPPALPDFANVLHTLSGKEKAKKRDTITQHACARIQTLACTYTRPGPRHSTPMPVTRRPVPSIHRTHPSVHPSSYDQVPWRQSWKTNRIEKHTVGEAKKKKKRKKHPRFAKRGAGLSLEGEKRRKKYGRRREEEQI